MEKLSPTPEIDSRINNPNLAHMGALIVEAARNGPGSIVSDHVSATALQNPNSVGEGLFFGADTPSVSTRADQAYRQVDEVAIDDLGISGIVRNSPTPGETKKRWGDRVFWNEGRHSSQMQLGGRFIIAAALSDTNQGWITADKVTGVYAQDTDGHVKNLLPEK